MLENAWPAPFMTDTSADGAGSASLFKTCGVYTVAPFTKTFCLIHGHIALSHQVIARKARLLCQRDANAGRKSGKGLVAVKRFVHGDQKFLGAIAQKSLGT